MTTAPELRALATTLTNTYRDLGSPQVAYDCVWNTKEWLLDCADAVENKKRVDPAVKSISWVPGKGTRVELTNGFVDIFDVPARATLDNLNATRDQRIAAQAVVDYWRERHQGGSVS